MYKIEPHLHTTYVSYCGYLGSQPIIKAYKEAGYDAICITDHFNRTTFDYIDVDLHSDVDKVKAFLVGYERLKKEGDKRGIKVYLGAELRFDTDESDYLLYGFHPELLSDPDKIIREGLEAFAPKYKADGAVMFQAHPFRPKCTPAAPELIDGVEVYNASPRHDSRNDLALAYAEKYNLLKLHGSDAHRPGDEAKTGILTDVLPEDSYAFGQLLKSGNYSLIEQ